ncbi:MAG: AEC family transporter [Pseudomonadota bacterium]
MSVVLTVVAPVFLVVALGFALAKSKVISGAQTEGLTRFMYFVAIPAMLINNLATVNLPNELPWRFLLAFYGPSFAVFFAGALSAAYFLQWRGGSLGIAAMTACYSNIVLLGYPLLTQAYGPAALLPLYVLLATQSLLLFPTTVLTVKTLEARALGSGSSPLRAIGSALLNPIVVSMVAGLGLNFFDLSVPHTINQGLSLLGAAAPGCALIALGLNLGAFKLEGGMWDTLLFVVLKNVFSPLLVWWACNALDVPVEWTKIAVVLALMPSGINAFIFAAQMGYQQQRIAQTIIVSTVVSALLCPWALAYFSVD